MGGPVGLGNHLTANLTQMTEHVRARLARQISAQQTRDGAIPIVTLSPEWDSAFAERITGQGDQPTLLRKQNGQWSPIPQGQTVILSHGDQISLDYSDPEGAVFECQAEMQMY